VFPCNLYGLSARLLNFCGRLVKQYVDRSNIAAETHFSVKDFFCLCDIDLLVEEDGGAAGLYELLKSVSGIAADVQYSVYPLGFCPVAHFPERGNGKFQ